MARGRPITLALFPHADHGIYAYETATDGTRLSTRDPDGHFAMMRDFIRCARLHDTGKDAATITRPLTGEAAGAR